MYCTVMLCYVIILYYILYYIILYYIILYYIILLYTRQTITLTSTRDCMCSHKYTLIAQYIITSNRSYCITKQRLNNILIYFNNNNMEF